MSGPVNDELVVLEGYVPSARTSESDDIPMVTKPTDGLVTGSVFPDATSPYGREVDYGEDAASQPGESSPPNAFMAALQSIVPYGGLVANTYNLGSITLGGGIITLPAAFNQTGYGLAIIVLVFCTWATVYSMYLLATVVDKTNLKSYEKMTQKLFGRGWDYFLAVVMWFLEFGSLVSYVISIGDLLTPALQPTDAAGNMIRIESLPPYLQTTGGNRCLVSLIWFCIMLPLSLPKKINTLRYASVIGVTCIMYFVICVIVHSVQGFENGHSKQQMVAFKSGTNVTVGFSLFIFSYLCHPNFFKIYTEMQNRSPARFSVQATISMSACCIMYIITGMFGYADFGSAITDSILLYYNVREDVMVAVAYFGVGFKLCVAFALTLQPVRDAVYYICHIDVEKIAWWKNAVLCAFMSLAALVLGLFIPSVNIVFGLTGSFCGGIIGFIFPALYVMYAGNWGLKQVGWFHYISTYILLISGVIALVFGTVAAIYGQIVQ